VLAPTTASSSRRHALRRAVDIECGVLSDTWQDVAPLCATDLSPFGMWLATDLPLPLGDALVVSFKPPRWPSWGSPVVVLAEVVRVGMPRRRGDSGPAGMGLRFVDLDPEQAARMTNCLSGLPPTLPSMRAKRAARCEEQLVLDDGSTFELRAEGSLLTAGRPPYQPPPVAIAETRVTPRRCKATRARRLRTRVPRVVQKRVPRRPQAHVTH
jgi:hypothetical protein